MKQFFCPIVIAETYKLFDRQLVRLSRIRKYFKNVFLLMEGRLKNNPRYHHRRSNFFFRYRSPPN